MPRLALTIALLLWPVLAQAQTVAPPHALFHGVGVKDVVWGDGFWKERHTTTRASAIPAMGRLMMDGEENQFLNNFLVAAGTTPGTHRGPAWNDGDFYKWLEAAIAMDAVAPDPTLNARIDQAILAIGRAQRADGYLHTPVLIAERLSTPGPKAFQDRTNFEMYNFGHLFTAAALHSHTTGRKDLLAIAIRAADHLCQVFDQPTADLARNSVCPSHYMGLLDLYRATGNRKYRALLEKLVAMRDLMPEGTDDNQDRLPFRKQTEAVGHAVRANYLYAGMAELYLENGDKTLLGPLEAIWTNAATRKIYITGACGALYDGASPDGSSQQKTISRVHQAYGRDYQLPNSTAHNETCAAIGNVLWNWRMLQATGQVRHGDMLETTLYNAVLAGTSLEGTAYFYTNTLRQLDTMPVALRWNRERQEWIKCYCCPPNVLRLLAQVQTYSYGVGPKGVWVHLYGSSRLSTILPDGNRIGLRQDSDYPWHGDVTITLEQAPPVECSLMLRIPAWANGAELTVNGKPVTVTPGTYAEVRQKWTVGDVVKLKLPLKPKFMVSHPLVEETRNQVAVMCGPMVYCLESKDLPSGVSLHHVEVNGDSAPVWRGDKTAWGKTPTITVKGTVTKQDPWSSALYREWSPAPKVPVDLTLIPYYTWANRGRSEMSVWLPLTR
jgi:hypothetical protein